MEVLITVGCTTKTSRKSLSSPEEPTALRQHSQISHLGEAASVLGQHCLPETHPGELRCAEPPVPQLTRASTGVV